MLSLTSLAQNWVELRCQYASQMSLLVRCYCQHQPDKYVASCLWPSKPYTDSYFFIWQICLFLWKKTHRCCSQHVCYLLVPDVTKTACPWCGSLPQCISEKQLAYQAAGRGLMNRLCDLPPDRQRHRQQHWSQRQRQSYRSYSHRVVTWSYKMWNSAWHLNQVSVLKHKVYYKVSRL